MKLALAAVGFITGNVEYNKNKMIELMAEYSGKVDLILFGETFLQGFDSLCWEYSKDKHIAVEQDAPVIREIAWHAERNKLAVSFGYVEREADRLFSSQLTIGSDGKVVDNYRRVSVGWKELVADEHYCEGTRQSVFTYNGIRFSVGLCGDLWDDNIVNRMRKVQADIVLWPVYTDYNYMEWNTQIKYEYAKQAELFGDNVLYVNSLCMGVEADEIAKGGAAFFSNGLIQAETPSGEESVLVVEV